MGMAGERRQARRRLEGWKRTNRRLHFVTPSPSERNQDTVSYSISLLDLKVWVGRRTALISSNETPNSSSTKKSTPKISNTLGRHWNPLPLLTPARKVSATTLPTDSSILDIFSLVSSEPLWGPERIWWERRAGRVVTAIASVGIEEEVCRHVFVRWDAIFVDPSSFVEGGNSYAVGAKRARKGWWTYTANAPTATTYTRRWNFLGVEFCDGIGSRRSGFDRYSCVVR